MIHPSAVVSNNAEIDETTNIGPFCIIGDGVKIGKNNNLISHISIIGDTIIENNNTFYPFCSIGSEPQDLKYNKEKSVLFMSVNKAKFRKPILPNETISFEVKFLNSVRDVYKFKGTCYKEDIKVSEAEFSAMITYK